MADMFIRSETVSGMADTIRKITNKNVPINFAKFANGEVEEGYYEGKHTVRGKPNISDGSNIGVFVSLTETETDTYDTSYTTAIVSWNKNTEYDGTAEFEGTVLRYKKVIELTVPDNINAFKNPKYAITLKTSDGECYSYPLGDEEMVTEESGAYFCFGGAIWIKEASMINEEYGLNLQDNSVYIMDAAFVDSDDYISEVILTAQGPKAGWLLPEAGIERDYYDGSYILYDSNGEIVQSGGG